MIYEEYKSDLGEKAPKIVFEDFYNIKFKKISRKKNQKTPDYEITDLNENIIAYCEVKSLLDTLHSKDFSMQMSQEAILENSIKREVSYLSKLRNHHGKAILQLSNNHNLPTLIVFSSFNMTDHIDMDKMLQEHKNLYPQCPMADAYALMKIHQSVVPSNTFEIKYTIATRWNTDLGKYFLDKYLPPINTFQDLQKIGKLPKSFNIN